MGLVFLQGDTAMQSPLPKKPLECDHPTVATRGHNQDAYLREHGFRIFSRANGQQPRWERGGKVYVQSRALCIANGESKLLKGGKAK